MVHVIEGVRDIVGEAKLMVIGCQGRSTDAVSFFGHVSYDKVQYYLAAADILCMPMNDTLVERARWPIKMGDYMASGRPIVGSNVGEVGKMLLEIDKSLVSEPDKPSKMVASIIQLIKDESLSTEIGCKIRRLAEKRYAWTEKLETVYRDVLA
ncbi:MAG: glycosyltransferase [Nitrososphaerales archaeon]